MQKTANWCNIGRATIDILPEDVLLVIFDYYLAEAGMIEGWQKLVRVCQKWRYAVFRSPLRLNLQILCSDEKRVRKNLAIWPPLPIIIRQCYTSTTYSISEWGKDNILAALENNDRVREIYFTAPSLLLENAFEAMQKTFVALKTLELHAMDSTAPSHQRDEHPAGTTP